MNTYLKTAKQLTESIDMETYCVNSAPKGVDIDKAELRLEQFRQEGDALTDRWMERRNALVNMISDARKDLQQITKYADDRPATVKSGVSEHVWEALKRHIARLNEAYNELVDAIEYLHTYLHPEQEEEGVPLLIPFGDDVRIVVAAPFQTPQEAAELLVNTCLDTAGTKIAAQFAEYEEYGCGNPEIYDILFDLCEEEFEKNPVGAEFMDMCCYHEDFTRLSEMVRDYVQQSR